MKAMLLRGGLFVLLMAVMGTAQAQTAAKHAMSFDDLIKLHRVAAPEVSADGKWVAYSISIPDMEANRGASNVWIMSTAGGEAIQVSQGGHDSAPVWSPDGKTLGFLSSRDGNSQVYLLSMDGGEAKKLTQLSTGADSFKWSPDGKTIA